MGRLIESLKKIKATLDMFQEFALTFFSSALVIIYVNNLFNDMASIIFIIAVFHKILIVGSG